MSRKGKHSVLAWERVSWTVYGDDKCLWVDLPESEIHPEPLPLEDGRTVQPGDHVTRLGGKNTSAGYTTVEMLDGEWLVYRGVARSLDGVLAVFDRREQPDTTRVAWWYASGTQPKPWIAMFHHTPANSGRTVDTTHWKFYTP